MDFSTVCPHLCCRNHLRSHLKFTLARAGNDKTWPSQLLLRVDSLNFEAGKKTKKRMRKQSHAIGEILELTPVQLLVEPSARPPNTNMLTKIKEAWDAIWRNHQMSNKFQNSGLLTALWSNAGNLWIPMRYCRHFWHHHCVCLICQKNCNITSTWQNKQWWTHSKW